MLNMSYFSNLISIAPALLLVLDWYHLPVVSHEIT